MIRPTPFWPAAQALVLTLALGACSGSSSNIDAGNSDAGASGDAGNDAGVDCTVPAQVTANLELTTQCNPWLVTAAGVDVEGPSSPVLTIDPGVNVAFAAGAFLEVGVLQSGGLVANGSAASPISLASSVPGASPGAWVGVVMGPSTLSTSALAYVTVSNAGGATQPPTMPGGIIAYSDSATLRLSLSHVTVQHSAGSGVVFGGPSAGFAPNSGNLTLSEWDSSGYPIVIDANQAGTVPITFTSTSAAGDNVIALACQVVGTCGNPMTVDHSQTWPTQAIPYAVVTASGVQIDGAATSTATLTIAAPNTVMFVDGASLQVDGLAKGQGQLQANGTALNPIIFKSIDPTPTAGSWAGINLVVTSSNSLSGTSLSYCNIQDGSGFSVAYLGTTYFGEVVVGQVGDQGFQGPSITHCNISDYTVCGILTVGLSGATTAGYDAGNAFAPDGGSGATPVCGI
jgi:filamentous hemagglutinin family protein